MESISGVLFLVLSALILIHSGRRNAKIRTEIKARTNKEFDDEIELTNDDLKARLSEVELMYEELEQTYWEHIGALVGIASYFYWQNWYISFGVAILLIFVGGKYLSIKPFKSGIPDR